MKWQMGVLAVLLLLPTANAAVQINNQFQATHQVASQQFAGIPLLISAGQITATLNYNNEQVAVGGTTQVVVIITGPSILGILFTSGSMAFAGTGCTATNVAFGALNQNNGHTAVQNRITLDVNAGLGTDIQATYNMLITTTAPTCSGVMYVDFCTATVLTPNACTLYIAQYDFPINIHARMNGVMDFQCGANGVNYNAWTGTTQCLDPQIDNKNRLCAASVYGATCTDPKLLESDCLVATFGTVSGSCVGSTTNVNFPSAMNVIQKQCASSDVLPACTTPTLNLAGAVTIHNDGTLTVTNTGGQTMTLAGAVTVHNDGTLTVTNAGGQTISFTGPLTVHQDPICTLALPCYTNTNTTVNIGNATQAQNIAVTNAPGFWELFGPTIFVLALIVVLPTAKIWLVPVGVAFGAMVAIMAFSQPHVVLVVMQAASGFCLMSFSLYWLGLRFREFNPKERKWFQ